MKERESERGEKRKKKEKTKRKEKEKRSKKSASAIASVRLLLSSRRRDRSFANASILGRALDLLTREKAQNMRSEIKCDRLLPLGVKKKRERNAGKEKKTGERGDECFSFPSREAMDDGRRRFFRSPPLFFLSLFTTPPLLSLYR